MDSKSQKSLEIHYTIEKMIALDNQLYSIVEDSGFLQLLNKLQPKYKVLGKKYFTQTIISNIYTKVH